MRYRRRGSRKASDNITAIKFMGWGKWPLMDMRRKKPVIPDWMPNVTRQVFDQLGTYDGDEMEVIPAGECWALGADKVRFGQADGHFDVATGDFIVRYDNGTIGSLTAKDLYQEYRGV